MEQIRNLAYLLYTEEELERMLELEKHKPIAKRRRLLEEGLSRDINLGIYLNSEDIKSFEDFADKVRRKNKEILEIYEGNQSSRDYRWNRNMVDRIELYLEAIEDFLRADIHVASE